jgi:chromatin structure-remodeling complex subunit SFH1
MPDAGEIDSDGSDFVASGGLRTSVRNARVNVAGGGGAGVASPRPPLHSNVSGGKAELDQNYLGIMPPMRFITAKPAIQTRQEYNLYVLPQKA